MTNWCLYAEKRHCAELQTTYSNRDDLGFCLLAYFVSCRPWYGYLLVSQGPFTILPIRLGLIIYTTAREFHDILKLNIHGDVDY